MTAPREVRDRIARRWKAAGAPVLEHATTCQTEGGARRAGKRSGEPFRIVPASDGRYEVWLVRRGR